MYQIFRNLHIDEIKNILPPKSCILFHSVRSFPHFLLPIVTILDNSKATMVLAHFRINAILGADVLACFKIRTYYGCNIFYETTFFITKHTSSVFLDATSYSLRLPHSAELRNGKYVEPVVANLGALGVTRKSKIFYVDKWKGDRVLKERLLNSEHFLIQTFGCL